MPASLDAIGKLDVLWKTDWGWGVVADADSALHLAKDCADCPDDAWLLETYRLFRQQRMKAPGVKPYWIEFKAFMAGRLSHEAPAAALDDGFNPAPPEVVDRVFGSLRKLVRNLCDPNRDEPESGSIVPERGTKPQEGSVPESSGNRKLIRDNRQSISVDNRPDVSGEEDVENESIPF